MSGKPDPLKNTKAHELFRVVSCNLVDDFRNLIKTITYEDHSKHLNLPDNNVDGR